MGRNQDAELAERGHESVLGVGAALWRRKAWIILPTLLAFVGSLIFVTLARPRFTGEARVLLENRETAYSRADRDTRAQDPNIDAEAVASQVQNVMSRDLALKVVRDMGLANNPEFNTLLRGPGMMGKVMGLIGLGPKETMSGEDRAIATYLTRLMVYPQGKSRVISIEFQSEDAKLAADVANKIATEYLLREEGAKSDTSRSSSEWLDRAIDPLVKKVQAAEAKVEAFRSAKGLFMGTGGGTITTQQLTELNTQLTNARTQQADLQARARLIREAVRLGRIFETSEINNNELVRRLLEQRAALKAQMALEERTLLPGHPRMRELAAQLGDLEGQIRAAAERAARALENDARVSGARVASMQAEIDSQKKTAALSNEDEVQLKSLERDANTLREQLNSYRLKYLDAAARAGENAHPADARIISRAFPAIEPTFPKKLPIVLLATLGTLALTSTLIATNALMARAAASPAPLAAGQVDPYGYGAVPPAYAPVPAQPVEAMAYAPEPAGIAPAPVAEPAPRKGGLSLPFGLGKRVQPVVVQPAQSAPATAPEETFIPAEPSYGPAEELARELAMMDMRGHGRVIMVYALESEPRLSLITLRCARRLARDSAAVVLDLVGQGGDRMGGNIFARSLAPGAAGLNAYLDHTAALGDIIHRDSRTQLHIIPSGGPAFQRLAASAMRDQVSGLIEALRRSYSDVIVDGGTIGGSGELFAHHADAVVLISRRAEDDAFLTRTVEKLEALRDAPVFVVNEGEVETPRAANDQHALAAFSRA
ncbi:MAG: exopolysaccharide transport family protein [Proteobacteria bacterium]|nr:exopolysaccharide transport family protein [Pseudomonadota bacterium]